MDSLVSSPSIFPLELYNSVAVYWQKRSTVLVDGPPIRGFFICESRIYLTLVKPFPVHSQLLLIKRNLGNFQIGVPFCRSMLDVIVNIWWNTQSSVTSWRHSSVIDFLKQTASSPLFFISEICLARDTPGVTLIAYLNISNDPLTFLIFNDGMPDFLLISHPPLQSRQPFYNCQIGLKLILIGA